MLRLYFLVPNAQRTVQVAGELESLGLKKSEVHVLGKDQAQLKDMGVNRATMLQTSDVVNSTKRGALYGAPLGVLLGIVAAYLLPSIEGWAGAIALILGAGVFGGFFGAWASSMVGVSVLDVKVSKFRPDIDRGAFLMFVDVPEKRKREVSEAIKHHHPEVVIEEMAAEDKHRVGGQGA